MCIICTLQYSEQRKLQFNDFAFIYITVIYSTVTYNDIKLQYSTMQSPKIVIVLYKQGMLYKKRHWGSVNKMYRTVRNKRRVISLNSCETGRSLNKEHCVYYFYRGNFNLYFLCVFIFHMLYYERQYNSLFYKKAFCPLWIFLDYHMWR